MKITVHTRSCNDALYEKMRSFIPTQIDCVQHKNYNDWKDASRILHDLIERNTGIILINDEDNFITNWSEVERIATAMEWNNVMFAGVPDGGVLYHRQSMWSSANPFMLFLNCDLINSFKKNFSREQIDAFVADEKMEAYKPDFLLGPYNRHHEPFNGLFYWMLSIGRPLYLKASTLGDNISTEVKGLGGQTIAYHAWMSRDKNHAERINKLCSYAKKFLPL